MRNFIINQLTQSSTWFGLIIMICAFLPAIVILFVGIIVMVLQDSRLQPFFAEMRVTVQKWWTE